MALSIAMLEMLDQELRQFRAKVAPIVRREALQNEILNQIEMESQIYTDRTWPMVF